MTSAERGAAAPKLPLHLDGDTNNLIDADGKALARFRQFAQGEAVARLCNSHAALSQRNEELMAGIRQWASECAECDGTGHLTGEIGFEEVCPDCADIRALLASHDEAKGGGQ